jgi:nitrogen fixation NifU-like protein
MTTAVKGKRLDEVQQMFDLFHRMVTGELPPGEQAGALGKLAVFSGVAQFPMRVKCASLSWHALRNAMTAAGSPDGGENPKQTHKE